jgi:hypothetical protein
MTCGYCGETVFGSGHGPSGEKQAYREAIAYLRSHQCLPREKSAPILKISGTDLDAIIEAITKAMPDVTITRPTV